ncbi:hypothetical protein [Nocardia sp. NPDC055049]
MNRADAERARRTHDALILATRAAAAATGIATAPDAESHTACAPQPWVHGFRSPLITGSSGATGSAELGSPVAVITSSYHPNHTGMSAVAAEIAAR